jgi:hypothetical protein
MFIQDIPFLIDLFESCPVRLQLDALVGGGFAGHEPDSAARAPALMQVA